VQRLGLGDRACGVVREARRDLQRHPAVPAPSCIPDRLEQRGGIAEVVERQLEELRLGVEAAGRQLALLLVVGVARGDRFVEDRRV